MTSASAILNGLPPLKGELPAASPRDVTLMVCVRADDADAKMLSALAMAKARAGAARVHVHVPGASALERARITLWAEAHTDTQLSATYEDAPGQDAASEALGLIRLFQIAGLARGAYAYCTLSDAPHLPGGLSATAQQTAVAIADDDTRPSLTLDGSDTALAVLAKIAEPLAKRVRMGDVKEGDAPKAVRTVTSALQAGSGEAVGRFPITPSQAADTAPGEAASISLWPEGDGLKVLLLKPDIALPFKSPDLVADAQRRREGSPFLTGAHGALRASWSACFDALEQALEARGHRAVRLERPGTEITAELADEAGADVVILPHRQRFQCDVKTPALYLMQIAHRWLFTLDEDGWGAGAAAYPYDGFEDSPADSGVLERYLDQITGANDSKFGQPNRRTREDLIRNGTLPDAPYLFFPCQIPDDEVVRFFCDISERGAIAALSRWATERKIHIVFKAHPAAPDTAEEFRAIANTPFTHWADVSIHDLIENCQAVVTLNSGVGHEAILHGKPVIMFGQAEYDTLALQTAPQDLDAAFAAVQEWDETSQLKKYRQFYHWFTRDMALDLSDDAAKAAALTRVIDRIERLV